MSGNRRFLVHDDGRPFFYLGDTAWELFHRLTREEADLYLEDRARKGFSVIQAVALAELDGLNDPNPYGHTPLIENDPARPDENYFRHVDYIVEKAASLGLYIGMLPTWGRYVTTASWETSSPVIFRPENARLYGQFLGERYRDKPVIWILGGDSPADGVTDTWRAMALGLEEGDLGRHLMTYHPGGEQASSTWFHEDDWLDFNMIQSGHGRRELDNYIRIAQDYIRIPPKPCMDGEPRYEDHPIGFNPENGWYDECDVRQAAYSALFVGAHGHTYGCHDIWQFWQPGRKPITAARTPWRQAIHLPGASQMRLVRQLMESRPFFLRIPDRQIIADTGANDVNYIATTCGSDGSYALVYLPIGGTVTVNVGRLAAKELNATWFDPRQGTAIPAGRFPNTDTLTFAAPSRGRGFDWVLALDDAACDFQAPGIIP
ncbi:MAG: glycoside hydrolase family 140 protein [Armatimonadetes bacterium]|nr:glycoside hydrolase family 140 protein [Armatimonadota bacterium]